MNKRFKYFIPVVLQKVGYVLFGVLYRVFFKLEIRGRENIKGLKGPVIFASNHASEIDVTLIPLFLPFISPLYPLYFVANPVEKYSNFGWRSYIYGTGFFTYLGGYSVNSGFKDYAIALEDHIDLIEKGRTIFMFPEGKRTSDGNLSRGRGGLGYLVYKTGVVVVPIAVDTLYNLSWKEFLFKRRKIVITVLPPMHDNEIAQALEPTVDDYQHTSQLVLDKIESALI